jgi:hypothetical protein
MARGRVTGQGRRGLAVLLALFGFLAIVGPVSFARAEFEIVPGSFTARMLNAEGNPENRAGSHPDRLEIGFALNLDGATPRNLVFELPAGFGGNPGAVQQCPRALFEAGEECPPESQTGTLRFAVTGGGNADLPVFQLEPGPGEFLSFASKAALEAPLETELRASDFGITLRADELPKQAVTEGHMELWGVPADHQTGTAIPPRPLLTAPTRCGPLVFTFRTRSWLEGAPWLSASSDTGAPLEGCAGLAFEPSVGMALSNPVADSPTGVRMELTTPEEADGSELADALVKDATIELPAGVTVSPSGAAGLVACSDAQLDLGSTSEAHCPAGSKVGTIELASPALSDPLAGAVYLGEERGPERFRIFIVAPGPGLVVKFAGALHVDPVTGRFSATLADLPQLPFRRLSLSFDGGPRALLASPLACGPATTASRFVPYGGGPPLESRATVAIAAKIPGSQCPGAVPFAPRLVAHSSQTEIGHRTSLSVDLLRQDGEQVPRRFKLTLPAGLSAALGKVGPCAEAAVAAGACPAASRIGGVIAEAGSGPNPVALRGDAYVTGPYRGAPFGMLMQLNAAIGPFNLGAVSFRGAAAADGKTGRVTISTDKLPAEVEGVQVRFQAIKLSIDRPGLVRNPTSCRPASVDATIESSSGALATASSPLALSGCKRLGFRPRFEVALTGGDAELHRHGHPGLRISTRTRPGDTALRSMKMTLPGGLGFGLGGLEEICSRPDAAQGACPPGSRVGTALARTPLLSKPLKGAIYIVQPKGHGLPDLGISLTALGTNLSISGRTESEDGHFVTKLVGLPDMPMSSFTMRIGGGDDGSFSLQKGLCREGRPRRLDAALNAAGQDGSRRRLLIPLETNAHCP